MMHRPSVPNPWPGLLLRGFVACMVIACIVTIALGQAPPPATPGPAGPTGPPPPQEGASWVGESVNALQEAGWIGLVLLGVSIFALGFAVERFVRLRRSRVVPGGLAARIDEHVKAGRLDEAQQVATRSDSTLGRIVALMLDHRDAGGEEARVLADEVGTAELKLHHQRAYPLLVCGTLAPLLGLLGTVIGLIGAFRVIALAGEMGNPSLFAEEIAFALMTTAIGLVVAIPLLALYHFFKARTIRLAIDLEQQTNELIRRWFVRGELKKAPVQPAGPTAPVERGTPKEAAHV